ncbi:MAG TPA: SCO family protein [Thermoanaerobaculia bacterium]|nr:SCO family protein [Thermoanaerobaculia bacterium]
MKRIITGLTLSTLLLAPAAWALPPIPTDPGGPRVPASEMPGPLKQVGFDQLLGGQVPLDAAVRDDTGRTARLGSFLGERPAVLALAYYECPMLCTLVLQGLTGSLKTLSFDVGREFDVIVVSIDPGETPQMAAEKKQEIVNRYGRHGSAAGWHFLTADQQSITRIARSVGFRYYYDDQRDEYAHAAGVVVLTPQGRISRYLYGIEYAPRDMRLALIEAADAKIGSFVDQVLLYCYHYDPTIGRYSPVIMNILRLSAASAVAGLVLLIVLMRRRERRVAGPVGAV